MNVKAVKVVSMETISTIIIITMFGNVKVPGVVLRGTPLSSLVAKVFCSLNILSK